MSFTTEHAKQPRVIREIRNAKGELIQTQEEAHDAQAKGKTTTKHADETIVTDEKGSYEYQPTPLIAEADPPTDRESEISKVY